MNGKIIEDRGRERIRVINTDSNYNDFTVVRATVKADSFYEDNEKVVAFGFSEDSISVKIYKYDDENVYEGKIKVNNVSIWLPTEYKNNRFVSKFNSVSDNISKTCLGIKLDTELQFDRYIDKILDYYAKNHPSVYFTIAKKVNKIQLKQVENINQSMNISINQFNYHDSDNSIIFEIESELYYNGDTDSYMIEHNETITKNQFIRVNHWNVFDGGDCWNLERYEKNYDEPYGNWERVKESNYTEEECELMNKVKNFNLNIGLRM